MSVGPWPQAQQHVLSTCGGPLVCHKCAVSQAQAAIDHAQVLLAQAAKALARPPGPPADPGRTYPYVTRNPGGPRG